MPALILSNTKIRFTKTLAEAANGDHPDILYAKKGEIGILIGTGSYEGYWVTSETMPTQFGASEDEFEILKEGE